MNLLGRHVWRVASVAALVGLQAPLCVLACGEGQVAQAAVAERSQAPCHEEGPAPDDAPISDGACGCETAREAFLPLSEASWSVPTLVVFAATHGARVPPISATRWKAAVPEASDLPPPDLLLLKATLLI
jgi:hypothetical protein